MRYLILCSALLILSNISIAQSDKLFTEEDRKHLIENLNRTKNKMVAETESLSPNLWHFKPNKDSWCIAQVLEHMGIFERLVIQETKVAMNLDPRPELYSQALPDSLYLKWMAEKKPHTAPKQATPLGLMKEKDNLTFFLFGRNLLLDYVSKTEKDLKAQFTPRKSEANHLRSIHGLLVVHYGHTDRHIRQIGRIKSDANYPKN